MRLSREPAAMATESRRNWQRFSPLGKLGYLRQIKETRLRPAYVRAAAHRGHCGWRQGRFHHTVILLPRPDLAPVKSLRGATA
ncbi:hypothetical protein CBM2592_B10001 [Cupriavidus taiwanensis]|nr:hypothetical protein CBM2588_B10001 [Cupriavidus taiwanensis]SOY59737.1 hypothetical protein CBM2592_B10001 [Cupriavidus taiwanensis]SOY91777.1 hypothetical protein CBM2591_B10001 [Cupriavidus taiwanensis]SOZ28504.1 hypothetical protein CBM2608_B140404 [Cupriavidus taiwanensis]SOZ73439.1 hypothetical protein CBM2617_B190002 [Cupriavidus taiwanensis]